MPDPFVAGTGHTQAAQWQFGVMGQDPEQMRRGMTAMVAARVAQGVAIAILRGERGVMVSLGVKPLGGRECAERQAQVADQYQQEDKGREGPSSRRAEGSPCASGSSRTSRIAVHDRNITKSRLDREPPSAGASKG